MQIVPFRDVELGTDKIESQVEKPRSVQNADAKGDAFGDVLTQAIGSVDGLQVEADKQADLAANGAGNLHETSLALEKADIAMRVATKVRNKVIDAYQDIMRMSV